jgi:transcriptional regulator of acetoin/glycerol metabolism
MQPSVTVSGQEGLPDGFHTLDLSRPLDEITQEIIRLVMADCGGKQSAAAKSLGIGRSTIWRYLK